MHTMRIITDVPKTILEFVHKSQFLLPEQDIILEDVLASFILKASNIRPTEQRDQARLAIVYDVVFGDLAEKWKPLEWPYVLSLGEIALTEIDEGLVRIKMPPLLRVDSVSVLNPYTYTYIAIFRRLRGEVA